MAPLRFILILASVARLVQSHWIFARLKYDGEWKKPLQYIRDNTSPYEEWKYHCSNFLTKEYTWPTRWIDRPESVRCGRGNMDHTNVEVLTVKAGDEIEIAQSRWGPDQWTEAHYTNCADDKGFCAPKSLPGWNNNFIHPGPLIIHLSKVPDGQNISENDGSGDWVKIYTMGLNITQDQPLSWLLMDKDPHMKFRIPAQTPPGQYLMRMDTVTAGTANENIKVGECGSLAEMYPTCAHLHIVSDSKANFPKGVKIPEIFAPEEPGMLNVDIFGKFKLDDNYTYPGGQLWDGEKLIDDKPIYVS